MARHVSTTRHLWRVIQRRPISAWLAAPMALLVRLSVKAEPETWQREIART
jgi:hypothetical protein